MVGGKGGGRPDMAQAGGPMVDKISEAIKSVPKAVKEFAAVRKVLGYSVQKYRLGWSALLFLWRTLPFNFTEDENI